MAPLALALAALAARPAHAQTDVRVIRPNVMLLVDTSGSMEWRTGVANGTCGGADGDTCNRCSNNVPICSAACPETERRNRWTTALEVLTGTIQNFSCLERERNDPAQFDYLYPIGYHQPLSGGQPLWTSSATQSTDGILDAYRDRVRFGFMSFDNDYRPGTGADDGMFSYPVGTTVPFLANGCTTGATMINVGARRATTNPVSDIVPGGLVSVGPPTADATTLNAINDAIQATIVGTAAAEIRPYGGTPVAGMLDDARYYWTNHADVVDGSGGGGTGDPYFQCRGRYNVLITDGQPNMDFRPICEGGGQCPYLTPSETALAMSVSPAAVKTFVIAFNSDDADARAALEPIALAGGTTSVLYASNRAGLQAALSNVLDRIASTTSTRTAPVFATASSGTAAQYQFQSSFAIAAGFPWEGVLERQRTECQGTPPVPTAQTLDRTRDDFGAILNARTTARRLFTWVPPGASTSADLRQRFNWTTGQPTRTEIDTGITPDMMGVATESERNALLAWLRGDGGTVRANRRLGDIFHSNPVVVPPPEASLPDQTYAAFRQRALTVAGWRTVARTIGTRETAVYVGTNDGILHAFDADTGEELWGFVPPYLIGSIRSMYPATHQVGVDGTPTTRDVIFARTTAAIGDANSWRTVLVVGLRGGGGAYTALDVTDPRDPQFLWQFTDPDLVSAYGTPAIGTVFAEVNGVRAEHAVAVLSGGGGVASPTCAAPGGSRPARTDTRITNAGNVGLPTRNIRCWQGTTGQYLYVVDLATGNIIRKIGPTGSPLVGSPALFLGTAGAVATRAYVGDADGALWRLDMSDPLPTNWQFSALFDAFYDEPDFTKGQPIAAQPVLSLDRDNSLLITIGSGDVDALEGFDHNRIAVWRERINPSVSGTVGAGDIVADRVWQLAYNLDPDQGLYAGERLTGPISLFNNVLYFGTFVPASGTNACQMGWSRLWGVDLSVATGGLPAPRLDLDGNPATTGDIARYTRDLNANGSTDDDVNSVLFGVGITRTLTCTTPVTLPDPYLGGTRDTIGSMSGGEFRLVIQSGTAGAAAGGSRTNVVTRVLAPPVVEARVDSWAVVFE